MTRVSIVVPCYDDGAHLGEAVTSALAQTHDDLEVVVVDDGSTDPLTLRVLGSVRDLGARVVRGDHAGVSAARNTAIEAATGDYVLPLDADDLLVEDFVAVAAAVLDADPGAGIVGAGTEFFGAGSGAVHPDQPTPASWLVANQLPVSAMFRRADWELCGGYPVDVAWGEDWLFWVRLVALGRGVRVLPDVGLRYRRRADQVTATIDWKAQEATRARVIAEGLPIIEQHLDEAARLLAQQLNQLQAVRARRGERLRSAVVRRLRPDTR